MRLMPVSNWAWDMMGRGTGQRSWHRCGLGVNGTLSTSTVTVNVIWVRHPATAPALIWPGVGCRTTVGIVN
ncbi:MAG: hypothetical protein R2867_41960 [Caldilineaceae bacterium]